LPRLRSGGASLPRKGRARYYFYRAVVSLKFALTIRPAMVLVFAAQLSE
jgi:hypothetical protein